ncbi:ABC transporter permease [Neobacillus sp. PS3-40]|uniref:ABC transporter permease n=1 Tax=Neobacillus sp. PS3-40 TaxID=3070679 RepID=UPI0027DF2805|nr:ABC transporter permease [Neobacillus sp. PS3-40]WML42795.1 ABC transporter permease [Neobacillus sp. PS3-40]
MLRFIGRRLLFLLFLLFGVALFVFILSHLVPSDPVAANLSQSAMNNPEIVAAFKEKWGLDRSLFRQLILYFQHLLTGDLGTSIRTGNPVLNDLRQFFPATFELSIVAMAIALILGILFGIISAIYRNKSIDHVIRTISISGVSIPSFWFALIMLNVFSSVLGITPGPGRIDSRAATPEGGTGLLLFDSLISGNFQLFSDVVMHLILPGTVLGFFTMGLIARQTRSNLLEVMSLDYIRTARSKGQKESAVIIKHALSNSMIPVITVAGMGFCNLLGGMVLVENIFAWPGIGQYAYLSAVSLDFPAICGVSLLIAFIYVVINLLIDILYGVIDPRVRYR